jgi:hypothetical protein
MSNEHTCEFCHAIGPDGEVISMHHPEHHSWTVVPAPQTGTTSFWPTTTAIAPSYEINEIKQTPILYALDEKSLEAIREMIHKEIQAAFYAYGDDPHL